MLGSLNLVHFSPGPNLLTNIIELRPGSCPVVGLGVKMYNRSDLAFSKIVVEIMTLALFSSLES